MSDSSAHTNLKFAHFEVDPAARQLIVDGRSAKLGGRAFDVLMALVEHRERVVSKNELLDLVWPSLVVEENNLHVHIAALRKLLGPAVIATIAGRGYRFLMTPMNTAMPSTRTFGMRAGRVRPTARARANAVADSSRIRPQHNLPQQLTSFVGRNRESAELKGLMANTRLLTLIGAGGLGKTRLALQLAAELMDDFSGGVWFVDLAPLTDALQLPQAVASVLDVSEHRGRPLLEALIARLQDRQLLLILDNCEHIIEACASFTHRLLQAGPYGKVLATSREALRLTGETTYSVPPLVGPRQQDIPTLPTLMQYPAVQLFCDRAMAAQPQFRLRHGNAVDVATICGSLDGIPLAIELAAARVRTLPIEKITERMNDVFRLLAGGDRTALPRHQTMRALVDWSFELLTAREQSMLRRLSVFAGGWTLEAAEAV
ncbi:MAG TPA: winged helix-turn-helix domain-containing protein, partial [Schlesneria sp.]